MTTLTRMKRKHTSESGNMEHMASYVLVLFDYDGCTLITTKRLLTGASSEVLNIASRTSMMYKGKQHDVEILKISDSFESLDAFEDEWTDSHRSLELTKEKQRRNSRKGNKYGGFLDIWPADPQDTEEAAGIQDCTTQPKKTNKRGKGKQACQSRKVAGETTLPKQTLIEGTNGRKVTVHFEGAEETNPQHAQPLRQPNYKDGLSLDQADLVQLHVQQFQENRSIVSTQTDHVILFDSAEDFHKELINSTKAKVSRGSQCTPSSHTSTGTQTDVDTSETTNQLILQKLEHLIELQNRRLCTSFIEEETPQIPTLSRPVRRRRLELESVSSQPLDTTSLQITSEVPPVSTSAVPQSTATNETMSNEALLSIYDFTSSTSPCLSRPASPVLSCTTHEDLFTLIDSDISTCMPCSGSTIHSFEIRQSDQPMIYDLDVQNPELTVEDLDAETLFNIKDNKTNLLFAWTLTKKLFTPQEFVGRNFYGNRGKSGLSPRRRRAIVSAIQRTCGSGEVKKAVDAINSGLRKFNR